jgi:hypothetical protein
MLRLLGLGAQATDYKIGSLAGSRMSRRTASAAAAENQVMDCKGYLGLVGDLLAAPDPCGRESASPKRGRSAGQNKYAPI